MRGVLFVMIWCGLALVGCPTPSGSDVGADSGPDSWRPDVFGNEIVTGCASAAECDDHVDCTDDTCVGRNCYHTTVPARCSAGTYCDPFTGCVTSRVCATTSDCADTNVCTINERCDPATRTCLFDALDGDHDSFLARACGGTDCDDSNPSIHPGATEICNGIDDNCDGQVDETFDLMTDVHNCGACGSSCMGGTCTAGACHCGSQTCPTGSSCNAGTCQCNDRSFLVCGDACVSTYGDTNNCGGCGIRCASNQCCVRGYCSDATCTPAQEVSCSGHPTCLYADTSNCGACGHVCAAGQTCCSGQCF